MIERVRNPLSYAFLGPLPNEAALSVIKHFSGTSLFRLKEVDFRASALVNDLLQCLDYWRGLGFAKGHEPKAFEVGRAISVVQKVGQPPTILDMPRLSTPLSWRILTVLNIAIRDASSNPQAVAGRAARLGDIDLCREAFNSALPFDKSQCMRNAILGGHLRIVDMLIHMGVSASLNHFRDSIRRGEIVIAERLAAHNPHLLREISGLQCAALLGKTEELDAIEINVGEWEGLYRLPGPLHFAAMEGDTEAIEKLSTLGCPIDVRDHYFGQTALHYAAMFGHTKAIRKLHELGCDIHVKARNYGQTALHSAAESGHSDAITLLVELGFSIETIDRYGLTALHYAASSGRVDAITKLHELRCDMEVRGQQGQTALHHAAVNGHTGAITELVRLGCPVGVTDNYSRTALMEAVQNGHMDAAKLLESLEASM